MVASPPPGFGINDLRSRGDENGQQCAIITLDGVVVNVLLRQAIYIYRVPVHTEASWQVCATQAHR